MHASQGDDRVERRAELYDYTSLSPFLIWEFNLLFKLHHVASFLTCFLKLFITFAFETFFCSKGTGGGNGGVVWVLI